MLAVERLVLTKLPLREAEAAEDDGERAATADAAAGAAAAAQGTGQRAAAGDAAAGDAAAGDAAAGDAAAGDAALGTACGAVVLQPPPWPSLSEASWTAEGVEMAELLAVDWTQRYHEGSDTRYPITSLDRRTRRIRDNAEP